MSASDVKRALKLLADPERAKSSARFFKTGPGQYGEGDRFIGVTVPAQRVVAREYEAEPLQELSTLLASAVHEERLTALLILVRQFQRAQGPRGLDPEKQAAVYDFYLQRLDQVNNWDLVDSSAPQILGQYLLSKPLAQRRRLLLLSRSSNPWHRRVAIITTQAFIRKHQFEDTLKLATELLQDGDDLIHKAVGWMLREMGKRDLSTLRRFLTEHHQRMPRTMLRYAIEKLSATERQRFMARTTPALR